MNIRATLLAGVLALAVFVSPAAALGCETIDYVTNLLDGMGIAYVRIPADELASFSVSVGAKPEVVTNAIVALAGDVPVYGLEIDGCMTPPTPLPLGV